MGNASSMLTQYDIEDVQDHCNHLCKFFLTHLFSLLFIPFLAQLTNWKKLTAVTQQEIVSLYQRFCQLDRNSKGFISADEFMSVPEFAMNPLSQVCF